MGGTSLARGAALSSAQVQSRAIGHLLSRRWVVALPTTYKSRNSVRATSPAHLSPGARSYYTTATVTVTATKDGTDPLKYNLSVAGTGFTPTAVQWTFGDGTPAVQSGSLSTTHTYAAAGTYPVTCYAWSPTARKSGTDTKNAVPTATLLVEPGVTDGDEPAA